jgi:hypothetical protein
MMVIESKNPCKPLLTLSTPSNRWVNMPGASKLPIPKLNAAASTNRSRRVNRIYDSTRTPDTATEANRNVVTPPRTGLGTKNISLGMNGIYVDSGSRTSKEDSSEFSEDTEEDEEEAAPTSRTTVGTPSDRNDSVVLQ